MHIVRKKRNLISFPVFAGSLAVAGGLFLVTLVFINLLIPHELIGSMPTAVLNIIPGPTQTPLPTSTPQAVDAVQPTPNANGFGVGIYVQISRTGGDGLRFRALPGVNSETLFVAFEPEVFFIQSGPEIGDGYTWWYLSAPYDQTRIGWAAENFLTPLNTQEP
jgi:hypothetical protein